MHRAAATVLVILGVCLPSTLRAQWTNIKTQVYSPAFGEDRFIQICLPPQYDQDRDVPYAVFYGLSGILSAQSAESCEEQDWYTSLGFEPPIVVVLSSDVISSAIEATSWHGVRGWPWTNSELLGPYEDYVFDIITHIDTTYNTAKTRDKRAVRGSSITAGGGARMGLKYHDTFSALMADNGFPDFGPVYSDETGPPYGLTFFESILAENTGPPYAFSPTGPVTRAVFSWASALSPNMQNPPYYIDFILDSDGEVDAAVKALWLNRHGTRYARDLPPEVSVKIWLDYYPSDQVGANITTQSFADSLDLFGIPYELMINDCGHGGPCSDEAALRDARGQFIADALNLPVVTGLADIPRVAQDYLYANYPNPFEETTRISYRLGLPGQVMLRVYNALGQQVETMYSGYQPAGLYTASWTVPNRISSGVYFITLRTQRETIVRAVLLAE